jgi:hypothetical protein
VSFVVLPSRKPQFWAEVDRLNKQEAKASKSKAKPEVAEPAAKAPAKKAKKGARK